MSESINQSINRPLWSTAVVFEGQAETGDEEDNRVECLLSRLEGGEIERKDST